MKNLLRALCFVGLIVTIVVLLGCAPALYSQQDFGSMAAKYGKINKGSSESDVLLQFGAPDAVYAGQGTTKALVYTMGEGMTVVFGVYSKTQRKDTVIVIEEGKVVDVQNVERGKGSTILGLAETIPLPSAGSWVGSMMGGSTGSNGILFRGPLNYSQETGE